MGMITKRYADELIHKSLIMSWLMEEKRYPHGMGWSGRYQEDVSMVRDGLEIIMVGGTIHFNIVIDVEYERQKKAR